MNASRFATRVFRSAVAVTMLMWGSTATPAQVKRGVTFEGGRVSLEACLSARAAVGHARTLLRAKDPSYRPYVQAARNSVSNALTASALLAWPTELQRRHRYIDRALAATATWLSRSENPRIAARFGLIGRNVHVAQQRLARATLLLDGVVPDPKPDLSDDPVTPATEVPPPNDVPWSNLVPSADSRIIYVSTSTGSDSNDGLSPTPDGQGHGPKKGCGREGGLDVARQGFPDWVLLKRGDIWTSNDISHSWGGQYSDIGWGAKGGRSASEPMVISSYGDPSLPRPIVQNSRFTYASNLVIEGIHFVRSTNDNNGATCIMPQDSGMHDITIENCYIGNYTIENILIDGATNVTIRGCVIVDCHGIDHASQGILIGHSSGILIEWCVLDNNGWVNGYSSQYNHNVYESETNLTGMIFRNNISARSSSHGVHQRTGGTCDNNLFLYNANNNFGISGLDWPTQKASGTVAHNTFLDGHDLDDSGPRGIAMWLSNVSNVQVYDNVVAHNVHGQQGIAFDVQSHAENLSIHDNIIYKWTSPGSYAIEIEGVPDAPISVSNNIIRGGVGYCVYHIGSIIGSQHAFSGNTYFSADVNANSLFLANVAVTGLAIGPADWPARSGEVNATYTDPSFPDPERDIASYMTSLGGAPTLAAFMAEARKQERSNWRNAYTPKAVGTYIRQGFGK